MYAAPVAFLTLTMSVLRVSVLALLAVLALTAVSVSTAAPARGHLFTPHQRVELVHQLADGSDAKGSSKNCVICALIVALMEQFAWDTNASLEAAATQWCADATEELPGLTAVCDSMLTPIITKLASDFANKVSPDVSCSTTLAMCPAQYAACELFPSGTWPPAAHSAETPRVGVHAQLHDTVAKKHRFYAQTAAKLLNLNAISDEMINAKLNELRGQGIDVGSAGEWIPVPIPDWDSDKYGSTFTYRGIQFRGKDCNDSNPNVYPGRNAFQGDFDAAEDSNCNGIWGVDSASGVPYEESMCSQYPSRGLLAVGDSATAHFSLPPSYVTPSGINMSTYSGLVQEALTEADWPQCSWSTAWATNAQCPHTILNISSIYQKMHDRNRCMHRDYVNAGVNGASVRNLIEDGPVIPSNYSGAMLGYPARYKNDGPSTVFFSMIGNDICGTKTWGGYTPVQEFHDKAVEEFQYLDTILAPGSHVIIMGVVDGRVLYDTLHNAIHPIGTPYPDFYDYLNCLDISPCWGWMNANETIRDASTAWAQNLNAQYADIMASNTFKNFDLHYIFPDYAAIIAAWEAQGHSALDLIEPVDGFHPSQTGNMLLANAMWTFLGANVPDALGPENPNNDAIVAQFGDQGGYGM